MDKRNYLSPEMEVVSFLVTDVMLASVNKGYQSDPFDSNPFEGASVWVRL